MLFSSTWNQQKLKVRSAESSAQSVNLSQRLIRDFAHDVVSNGLSVQVGSSTCAIELVARDNKVVLLSTVFSDSRPFDLFETLAAVRWIMRGKQGDWWWVYHNNFSRFGQPVGSDQRIGRRPWRGTTHLYMSSEAMQWLLESFAVVSGSGSWMPIMWRIRRFKNDLTDEYGCKGTLRLDRKLRQVGHGGMFFCNWWILSY